MNILFLSLVDYDSFEERNIYTDLLREFLKHGHQVIAISPFERKQSKEEKIITEGQGAILKIRIGNTQKVNFIEKGISTILLESQILSKAKRFLKDVKFDLILYTTPPITFKKVIAYFKERDNAITYLLLKDIFPQNAVDIGALSKNGWKGILYNFFRRKETELYGVSDYIGCMSEANMKYVISHNRSVEAKNVEICPNSIEVIDKSVDDEKRQLIRGKYGIPNDKMVYVYGGNLGRPQGINFLIECLKSQRNCEDVFFLIVGDGTEYSKLEKYMESKASTNVKVMKRLPKEDYDTMVGACDVGMIFLDYHFTIPNFPSRLLAYMQARIPVLAVTDPNTDVGKTITEGKFGWWCESNDVASFEECVKESSSSDLLELGNNAYQYLVQNYDVNIAYNIIMKHFDKEK